MRGHGDRNLVGPPQLPTRLVGWPSPHQHSRGGEPTVIFRLSSVVTVEVLGTHRGTCFRSTAFRRIVVRVIQRDSFAEKHCYIWIIAPKNIYSKAPCDTLLKRPRTKRAKERENAQFGNTKPGTINGIGQWRPGQETASRECLNRLFPSLEDCVSILALHH